MVRKDMIFDTHIHFNDRQYQNGVVDGKDINTLLSESEIDGVGNWICASYDSESSLKAVEIANNDERIWAAIAIHPNDVSKHTQQDLELIDKLAKEERVVAIGETGLDYFYTKEDIDLQKKFFKEHIKIAMDNDLVLQMHIRDAKDVYEAYDDVIQILKEFKPNRSAVHCFSANAEYAQKFLDLGCYINIGGAVTFKNARDLQEAVTMIPLERMLLETDGPYLTPHPFRGQLNHPKNIMLTAIKIAELKGITVEEVIKTTTQNATDLFNL
ncbi:TatD family hydrolase [[Acholeplasma] multilocale]|uniref:TatD family hydrolase n=1 Tax=[Acholeplasma] multilocale TaxID=264638 RepID=UPI00047D0570|nr:TatD family hydrolase [[Acholeplasma] multilocale]